MTPENSFRAWITHDLEQYGLLRDLSDFFKEGKWQPRIGVGFRHVGERYIDSENEELLGSYNIVDIALFADYMDQLSFTLLIRNLFDEQYVEGALTPFRHGPLRVRSAPWSSIWITDIRIN